MSQHVREIPSLKIKFIDGTPCETSTYNLILPHLDSDFKNKNETYVAVSCFPPFMKRDEDNIIFDYIKDNIVDDKTKIIFDNSYEGHILSCLPGIHKIIDEVKLDSLNCYFLSGGVQAQEIYNQWCIDNQIDNKINIIVINSWERHIHQSIHAEKDFEFNIKNKEKLFLCFNRILRKHRVSLLGLLYNKNLVERAFYSFFKLSYGGKFSPLGLTPYLKLTKNTQSVIHRNIFKNMMNFPLLLNNKTGENTNSILSSDAELYDASYFSLVTETFFFKEENQTFDEVSVFFSEKIFKPIACKHPFILVSRPKSLFHLRHLGYKTFHPYIDESYDLMEDDEERLLAIVNEVERLSKKTTEEWIEWQTTIKDIVEHNFSVIKNKTNTDSYVIKEKNEIRRY